MIADYLKQGVFAGFVAGLAYGIYMLLVGSPLSQYAHDAGHSHDHGHGHGHSHDSGHAVSELTTAVVSAGSGVLWAIFLGGLFGVVFYFLEPALPGRGGLKAAVLGAGGFLTVSVTPWLVLPPAAPGAEQLYTVELRLGVYTGLVMLGAFVSILAVSAYNRLEPRHRGLALITGLVPVVALVLVVPAITPTVVTHPELSNDLVTAYQSLALLSQAAIWLVVAGTFTWLHERSEVPASTASSTQPTSTPKHT